MTNACRPPLGIGSSFFQRVWPWIQLIATERVKEDSTSRLTRKRHPLAATSYRLRRVVASKCTTGAALGT
jgi:hypothetical protein